uniref:ParB-like N-terminal domain-containing protein n=1 Tax=viral metagenome TaxID=1070528 RepID=A0A6M3KPV3_9ZZZZ
MDKIVKVPIDSIKPNPFQPASRIEVPEEVAIKYAESIKNHGLLQIPKVRQIFPKYEENIYEMADGWLRLSGYKWLNEGEKGYDKIPVIVEDLTDQQMADIVLETNQVRQDLNPIELAAVYQKYLTSFNITQTELARARNKSQGEISNTLRLLDLPAEVQGLIISREITETHGRCLLQIKDKYQLRLIALQARDEEWSVNTLAKNIERLIEQQNPKLAEQPTKEEAPPQEIPNVRFIPAKEYELHKEMHEGDEASEAEEKGTDKPINVWDEAKKTAGAATITPQAGTHVPPGEGPAPEKTEPATVLNPRKLTLMETSTGVFAGIQKLGKNPYMKTIVSLGGLEEAIEMLPVFIAEAEEFWS